MGGLFLEAIFKRLLVCIFGMAQSDFWPLAAIGADGNSRCSCIRPVPRSAPNDITTLTL